MRFFARPGRTQNDVQGFGGVVGQILNPPVFTPRHSGIRRWRISGIQKEFDIIEPLLDPGSRPTLRDLAGMTGYDTVS